MTPTKKRGGGKGFSHPKGGTNSFRVVLTQMFEVLTILEGGGTQKVSAL